MLCDLNSADNIGIFSYLFEAKFLRDSANSGTIRLQCIHPNSRAKATAKACTILSSGSPRKSACSAMSSTRHRRSTPRNVSCKPSNESPIVDATALLKLLDWCLKRQESFQGEESCTTTRKAECPPANRAGNSVTSQSESAVARAAERESAACSKDAESAGRPHCDACGEQGGVA